MRADRDRRGAERRGHRAEALAALALRLKGWRIVARRLKTAHGEVDLVIRKGDLLAFVEVKARRDHQAGVDAVTLTAQRRIRAAAEAFIARQPDSARLSWRHDIVTVAPWRWPVHLEDAF